MSSPEAILLTVGIGFGFGFLVILLAKVFLRRD